MSISHEVPFADEAEITEMYALIEGDAVSVEDAMGDIDDPEMDKLLEFTCPAVARRMLYGMELPPLPEIPAIPIVSATNETTAPRSNGLEEARRAAAMSAELGRKRRGVAHYSLAHDAVRAVRLQQTYSQPRT